MSCTTHIFTHQGFCVYEALAHRDMIMSVLPLLIFQIKYNFSPNKV